MGSRRNSTNVPCTTRNRLFSMQCHLFQSVDTISSEMNIENLSLWSLHYNDTTEIFLMTGMYIMAHQPFLTAYYINAFHQSVCLYVCHLIVARQGLCKNRYRGNKYARNIRRIIGRVVFYAVCVVSKESRRSVLPKNFLFVYCVTSVLSIRFCEGHLVLSRAMKRALGG
jgi:hypothetical protein